MPRGRRSRSGRRPRPGAGLPGDARAGLGRAGRERDLGERAPRRGRRARSGDRETRRLGRLEHAARILRHLGSSKRRSADACSVVAGPADGERLRRPARVRARRRHPTKERAAARSHVLRRQGALAPRPPPIGAGPRQGGGDLHRDDRLVHPVALRRRGGDRSRQRLPHATFRRRRRALGRGAAVDFRRAPRRHAARRRLDRAVSGGERARAPARRRFRRRGDGRFPFRSLRPRGLCAGAGQGDARDRLFRHGPRRPQGRQRRRLRRARASA